MPAPVARAERLRRIRRSVAAGTVALFVASLAAVVGWGRQPAVGSAAARIDGAAGTPAPAAVDPAAPGAADPPAPAAAAPAPQPDPAPLTSRAS